MMCKFAVIPKKLPKEMVEMLNKKCKECIDGKHNRETEKICIDHCKHYPDECGLVKCPDEKDWKQEIRDFRISPEQLHEWYLDATKKLNPKSFNKEAQKPYSKLTKEQRFIDCFIADKIADHISNEIKEHITLAEERFNKFHNQQMDNLYNDIEKYVEEIERLEADKQRMIEDIDEIIQGNTNQCGWLSGQKELKPATYLKIIIENFARIDLALEALKKQLEGK